MKLKLVIEWCLNLIFPPKCGICGNLANLYLCNNCKNILKKLQINNNIIIDNKYFSRALWIYEYSDIIRETIIKYKFGEKSYISRTFIEDINNNNLVSEYINGFDYIVPVPLSKKRLKERGYNQVELIVKGIVKNKSVIGVYDLIQKTKNIKPQSLLNKDEREINIKGAFSINKNSRFCCDIKKSILIMDDIYTTGSTVNECARALKEYGFSSIGVLTIAKK